VVEVIGRYSNPRHTPVDLQILLSTTPVESANPTAVRPPKQHQRRLPPEEAEELVAAYLAGATALTLAGKNSIHRTTVLALLERHQVSRRGRVLTPNHIERAVSSYASGRSCSSIGKELQVNPETIRQALLKAGVAMRRPGRPSVTKES
jgi:transposase-like protein